MGTRSMTMLIDQDGVTKVAQYGQWDGYAAGVGSHVLSIMKDKEFLAKLKTNLPKCRFLEEDGKDKVFLESYNRNAPKWSRDPDNRTQEQIRWWDTYCSRDLASVVLENIADSQDEEIILIDRSSTAIGDGWVEYSYVVNLQANTLSVYRHIDENPYKVYSLNDLPDIEVFIKDIDGEE